MFRILSFIVQAIVVFAIQIPIILLGYIVVPIALLFAKTDESTRKENGWALRTLPSWAWIWSNDDDGSLGDKRMWWANERCDGKPETIWNQFYWLAVRNPAHNTRYFWLFQTPPVEECYVQYVGTTDYVDDMPIETRGYQFIWAKHPEYKMTYYGFFGYFSYPFTDKYTLRIRVGYKLRGITKRNGTKGFTVSINPFDAAR